ncbi:MAG: O-antigen ligase family protein [Lentisphaeria bacterium]
MNISAHNFIIGKARLLIAYLPIIALFAAYPLALVFPGGGWGPQLRFHFYLPVFLWVSLVSITFILTASFSRRQRRTEAVSSSLDSSMSEVSDRKDIPVHWLKPIFLVVIGYVILSSAVSREFSLMKSLTTIGYFSIPLYFAVCPWRFTKRSFSGIMALLWLISSIHGLFQFSTGAEVVGITGNRNWMASLTLALTPWFLFFCWEEVKRRVRDSFKQGMAATVLIMAVGLISLILLVGAASRAAWLGLAVYLFILLPGWFLIIRKRRVVIYVLWIVLLIIAVSFAGWRFRETWRDVYAQDIRPPLWQSTATMISENPLYGVGPGHFRSAFPAYRSSEQLRRKVAAAVTEHPHNQILHLAAETGIPLALVWLAILLPLIRIPRKDVWRWLVHFSAFILIFHSMFDKVLVQPPTNILGLILLGLLWRPFIPVRGSLQSGFHTSRYSSLLIYPLVIFFVTIGVIHTISVGTGSWLFRQGVEYEYEEKYDKAVIAYSKAGAYLPHYPKAFAVAGETALKRLQNPERALRFYEKALAVDPNYGHINLGVGIALGSLGDHQRAKGFFQREARLFPDSVRAYEYLVRSALLSGDTANLPKWQNRLKENRLNKLTGLAGEDEGYARQSRQLASEWFEAVQTGSRERAVQKATEMVPDRLYYNPRHPKADEILNGLPELKQFCKTDFHAVDFKYWRALVELINFVHDKNTPIEVIASENFQDYVAGIPIDKQAFITAEIFRQFGWDAAAVEVSGGKNISKGENNAESEGDESAWFVQAFDKSNSPAVVKIAGLEISSATTLWRMLADADKSDGQGTPRIIRLRLSCWPQEMAVKSEVLGQILEEMDSNKLPKLGESPLVRFFRWRERMKAENVEIQLEVKLDWSWSRSILLE